MALFTAFSGLDPMPWPGRHPNLFRTVEGNLYALCGLVVLAAATWWTFRTCAGSSGRMTPGPADMDRADDAEQRTWPIA